MTTMLLVVSISLIFSGLVFAYWTRESMMSGFGRHHEDSAPFPFGTILFIIGLILLFLTVISFFLRRGREAPAGPQLIQPAPPVVQPPPTAQPEVQASGIPSEDVHKLAIRLLSGDERKMFRRIVDEGGEVLQKDLVAVGIFSKAKVTRLLDKLERKGLIIRERYGATNRIRISKDLGK